MNNSHSHSSQPEAGRDFRVLTITLILLFVGSGLLLIRIFRCNFWEEYALFWTDFIFLILLFYWPAYLARTSLPPQSRTQFIQFRMFYDALLRVGFYFLAIFLIVSILYLIAWEVTSDFILFLPLLFVWPIYVGLQVKRKIRKFILPFSISMIVMVLIPFTDPPNPTLETFNKHLPVFNEVVSQVESGELKPSTVQNGAIELPCKYRYLVRCPGRDIKLEKQGNATTIFFCQDRWKFGAGISGFLYRSDSKDISTKSSDKSPGLDIKKLQDHWFWKMQENSLTPNGYLSDNQKQPMRIGIRILSL